MPATHPPVIAVVGSSAMDLTCYAEVLPAAGETIVGTLFTTGFGGKGANQAVMASRAGATVYMVGKVGDDVFGKSVLENFAVQGINTRYVGTSPLPTGIAHIWVDGAGENRILIIPGANHDIDVHEATAAINSIPELHIVIGQCEVVQEVTVAAFRAAKARGCITILNPAPYQPLSKELLALTDWLIPNETEFTQLHPDYAAPTSDEIIASLRPGKSVIVTLGPEGAAMVDSQGCISRVPSPRVIAQDSTGAGDCFIGTFSAALASGLDPSLAMAAACECAAISVTRKGAQSSYPSREETLSILDRLGAR